MTIQDDLPITSNDIVLSIEPEAVGALNSSYRISKLDACKNECLCISLIIFPMIAIISASVWQFVEPKYQGICTLFGMTSLIFSIFFAAIACAKAEHEDNE
ncbi:MAG: hypothetical protein H7A37_03605 [Chlamydiales bacterium]|nr:hypothetical protein [Chlamydiia bacterium]MCP5507373.1 hypothetical protein [Chlamydiales bacterium]